MGLDTFLLSHLHRLSQIEETIAYLDHTMAQLSDGLARHRRTAKELTHTPMLLRAYLSAEDTWDTREWTEIPLRMAALSPECECGETPEKSCDLQPIPSTTMASMS